MKSIFSVGRGSVARLSQQCTAGSSHLGILKSEAGRKVPANPSHPEGSQKDTPDMVPGLGTEPLGAPGWLEAATASQRRQETLGLLNAQFTFENRI